ncbi:acetate uptake transporter [Qaidamihabitans albus]|uniref:acetate uptake transporter n=1 Tax=Qaidamihabitans albus TaxID=2795733 RepID=UPI0018F26B08|nr:acetate uptake transporter [Qaidamihabitans albus]
MTRSATATNGHGQRDQSEFTFWKDHTHINLSPVAAPSILGLYGFAVATFMVAANLGGWYGNDTTTPLVLAPFAFTIGGIAQFLAGMWAYRARDALATGIHGAWGSFWIAYGIYHLLVAVGVVPGTATSAIAASAFGFWFIGLAAITWVGAFAAAAENLAISLVLLVLAAGATLLAIGLIAGLPLVETIAGNVLVASAVIAWYAASAMVLEAAFKRVVLPMGKRGPEPNTPGAKPKETIQYSLGEPGVKVGQ